MRYQSGDHFFAVRDIDAWEAFKAVLERRTVSEEASTGLRFSSNYYSGSLDSTGIPYNDFSSTNEMAWDVFSSRRITSSLGRSFSVSYD